MAELRRVFAGDVDRFLRESEPYRKSAAGRLARWSARATPQLLAVWLYRVSHLFHARGWESVARLLFQVNFLLHKLTIGPASCIGAGLYLPHPVGVIFHGRAGEDLTLFPQSGCLPALPAFDGPANLGPRLGDRVSVGVHSAVVGPINVGSDTHVGFLAILHEDAPAGSVILSHAIRNRVSFPGGPTDPRLER